MGKLAGIERMDVIDFGDWELNKSSDYPERVMEAELVAAMKQALAKDRGYSSYWHYPLNRQIAEHDVALTLKRFLTLSQPAMDGTIESLPADQDPPDTVLTTIDGNTIGIEVTELVHPEAIKEYIKAKKTSAEPCYVFTKWTAELIANDISDRIRIKNNKLENAAKKYDKIILAICTDELMIDEQAVLDAIKLINVECSNIDACYLLLSYHPNANEDQFPDKCPVFAINVR